MPRVASATALAAAAELQRCVGEAEQIKSEIERLRQLEERLEVERASLLLSPKTAGRLARQIASLHGTTALASGCEGGTNEDLMCQQGAVASWVVDSEHQNEAIMPLTAAIPTDMSADVMELPSDPAENDRHALLLVQSPCSRRFAHLAYHRVFLVTAINNWRQQLYLSNAVVACHYTPEDSLTMSLRCVKAIKPAFRTWRIVTWMLKRRLWALRRNSAQRFG